MEREAAQELGGGQRHDLHLVLVGVVPAAKAHDDAFDRDEAVGYWTWVPLDGSIVEHVVRTFTTLPEDVFLRAADCLHLVTALRQGFSEIHTHDAHQRNGAGALGLAAVAIE